MSETTEDEDVPLLAVKGLNEATQKARQSGDIVVVRGESLIKIFQDGTVEVLGSVPGRKKVSVRSIRRKR